MLKRITSKNSKGQKRSSSTLSSLSNANTSSTVSVEVIGSGDSGDELPSKRARCNPKRTTSTFIGQPRKEPDNSSSSKAKRRKSWIWLHFDEIRNTRTCSCKYCPSTFVISGTGTMSKHLHSKHPTIIAMSNPISHSTQGNIVTHSTQGKVVTHSTQGKVMKPPKVVPKYNANTAHKAYIEFVVTNSQAFSLGENTSFRKFVSVLQPLYKPLCATAVQDRLMQTYVKLRQQVIERISKSKVALTTDLWTSPNNLAFMVIAVAMWDERFKPVKVTIGFKHIVGENSGVNLAENFYETVGFYRLTNNMLAITTDNATSDQTFIDHVIYLTRNTTRPFKKDYWMRCFSHAIDVCVKCTLEEMFELFQKLRDLVVEIRASPQRIQKFNEILEESEFEDSELAFEEDELFSFDGAMITDDVLPVLDCPTRWSSTYFFLKRSLKLRRAIDEIGKDKELCKNLLKEEDWLVLGQVFSFLEEFALVTNYVEASQHPTLSLVVPMCNRLLNLLEETSRDESKHPLLVKGAASGLLKLSAYYDEASPVVMAATFLDPRCKMQYFIDNGWSCGGETVDAYVGIEENLIATRVKPVIQNVWNEYNVTPGRCDRLSDSKHVDESKSESSPSAKKGATGIKSKLNNSYFAQVVFRSSSQPSIKTEKDEMAEYEAEETEPADCEPSAIFDYWANRSSRWPKLCAMAKDLLSIPATTVASERAFSAGKDVISIPKMSLNPETAEALVCLRSWYRAGLVNEVEVQEFIEENGDSHND